MIYFDNAATTFPKPKIVYDTMDHFARSSCVNAGRGSYKLAKEAMEVIDETRKLIGELVHLNTGEGVIFTPSATIAINQVLNGLDWNNINNVFITPFEHNAIRRTLHYLQKIYEFKIHILPFDSLTFDFELSKAKIMFSEFKPELVLMSHVSNVTGFILPISKIVELAKGYEAITLIDCAQSLGVVDLNMNEIQCDFVVFAGHKSLYGPMGIAGFIQNNRNVKLKSYIVGGTGSDSKNLDMPDNFHNQYEAGSYNIYAISGLNAALKWIKETGIENIYKHKMELTNKLVEGLEDIDDIQLYLPKDREMHIGTVCFTVDEYSSEDVASILSEEFDIAVRAGHHCAPSIGEFLGDDAGNGTVRASLGYFNNEKEIESLLEALEDILR